MLGDLRDDGCGLEEPSRAPLAARLLAGIRPLDVDAAAAQPRDILLRPRMRPHHAVHRGCEHERRLGGETDRAQQIVSESASHAGDEIRACGCDEHQLGPPGKLDVSHRSLGGLVPQIAAHGSPRDRLESERRDEATRTSGHHDLHLRAALAQPPHQIRRLVGRDAAAHAEQDPARTERFIRLGAAVVG